MTLTTRPEIRLKNRTQLNVSVERAMKKQLEKMAERRGCKLAELVRQLLDAALETYDKPD